MIPTEKDCKLGIGFMINEKGYKNHTPIKEGIKLYKIAKHLQKMGMFETVVKKYE